MKFAVNLSTIFTEVPFLERFKKARDYGFSLVECQFPYESSINDIKLELDSNNLSLVLHNLSPGNWEVGERGISIFPDRVQEFRESVATGIAYATELNVKKIHCMAGTMENVDLTVARDCYMSNLSFAATEFAKHGITLLIEPINRFDMPNYFLASLKDAKEIIDEVSLPNIKLQFDFYHIQRIQGNLIDTFVKYYPYIGHVQLADVPGRHQPGTGEIDFTSIFSFLKQLKYDNVIGLEYFPKGTSENSFDWLQVN